MPGSTSIHPPIDEVQAWPDLPVGTVLELLKIEFDGHVRFRYPGIVIAADAPDPWIAVQCVWTLPAVETNGLWLIPEDRVIEYFSPAHPYNVFRVHAPDGTLRGWYANVTYPTVVEGTTLAWHDLWLDLIVLADGSFAVEDQDELDEAGIAESDPALHAAIVGACDELIRLATDRAFPFDHR